jgi:hypothetical protein
VEGPFPEASGRARKHTAHINVKAQDGTIRQKHKASVVKGLNDAPKVSSDRTTRVQSFKDAMTAAPDSALVAQVTPLSDVSWKVGLGDVVAVSYEDADADSCTAYLGRIMRMRRRVGPTKYINYVFPVDLKSPQLPDSNVYLQCHWYEEVSTEDARALYTYSDASSLEDVPITAVICPVVLQPLAQLDQPDDVNVANAKVYELPREYADVIRDNALSEAAASPLD